MFGKFLMSCTAVAISSGVLFAQETASLTGTALTAEAVAWDSIKDSKVSSEVFTFIESYPNSEFTKDAKALMIDLLWVEMSAPEAVNVSVVVEHAPTTFSGLLTEGSPDVIGKSIEKLIAGTPLFPPVEGLPEAYWKDQSCKNCHEWSAKNLCTQANTYLSDAGSVNVSKKHPYGGSFKLNLQHWATNDCG